jgi:hypothetical protein
MTAKVAPVLDRPQEVLEGPFRDSLASFPPVFIREAEVDPQQDACVHDFLRGVGEAMERSPAVRVQRRVEWHSKLRRDYVGHRERDVIRIKEERHGASRRTR